MSSETWQDELREFIQRIPGSDRDSSNDALSFFALAFDHTRCPDRAWFGVHSQAASLVVGGIFLAAIVRSGDDEGFWLLVDQEIPGLAGLEYRPIKSTRNSDEPLFWAHSASLDAIPSVVRESLFWQSFENASIKVLSASTAAGDRDSVQQTRQKTRLSDIWSVSSDRQIIEHQQDTAPTTKESLTITRIGQAIFRQQVLNNWGRCCAVTGSTVEAVIRASHIKPWRDSEEASERLDPFNGLPLIASLDALFDVGLISFSDDGGMLISSRLSESERSIFGLDGSGLRQRPPKETAAYLAYHRNHPFKP